MVEALETRRHLSATLTVLARGKAAQPTTSLKDGVLTVEGTKNGETIRPVIIKGQIAFVSSRGAAGPALVGESGDAGTLVNLTGRRVTTSTVNGKPAYTLARGRAGGSVLVRASPVTAYALTDVKKIVVNAGAGDDAVFVGLNVPVEIHGGAGKDTLNGGSEDDSLYGEAGNDRLDGGRGADLLDGGDGRDVLRARYASTLLGGDGNDRLFALAAGSKIDGGGGKDSAVVVGDDNDIDNVEGVNQGVVS